MKKVAVILAGGKGSRMKNSTSKPLTKLNNKNLIQYSIDSCKNLVDDIVIIYSDYSNDLLNEYPDLIFCKQEKPLGAGDALKSGLDVIKQYDKCLVLACDMPLITESTINKFMNDFEERELKCSYLVTELENPLNYGRIITKDSVIKVVEQADLTSEQELIKQVNTATYIFDVKTLQKYIHLMDRNNKKGEYLITDMIYHFSSNNEQSSVYFENDHRQFVGVNSLSELEIAALYMKEDLNE